MDPDESVNSEPRFKQYGFNVGAVKATPRPASPKTPEKPVMLSRLSGRTSSLDASTIRSGSVGKWLDGRSPLKRPSTLFTSSSQDSSNVSSSSRLRPRSSDISEKGGQDGCFKGFEAGSDFGDRKSTGDSSKWVLGADWQEEAQDSPLAVLREGSSFIHGFKDSCEAGSFTLGNFSQAVQSNGRIEVVGTLHSSEAVRRLVKSVVGGLRAWQQPEASLEGLGGTYFFMDEMGNKQAIVKPCDEEPLAPNNPKGFVGRELGEPGLKPTVRVGEAAMREVAAFLLDHHRFAKVPATALVRVTHNCFHVVSNIQSQASDPSSEAMHPSQASASSQLSNLMATTVTPLPMKRPVVKLASMQEFVSHQSDCSEMGPSRFSASDVHKIGILDLRLFNTDRHSGNLLVNQTEDKNAAHPWLARNVELIPIDHGFCLPEALEPPYFEWMHWPQAKVPFDEAELEYIAGLDANADTIFLQQELPWIPEGSVHILQVATTLLKECAAAGLTLFEIASIVSRQSMGMDEEASELEKLCMLTRQKLDYEMEFQAIPESDDDDAMDVLDELEGSPVGKRGVIMGHEMLINTQLSGDEMMFRLDEEPEEEPEALQPHEALSSLALPKLAGKLDQEQAPTEMAKSLFAGLFPRAQAGERHRRIRAGLASHKQRNRTHSRKPYNFAPPVMAGNLEAVTNVLVGLDKAKWPVFMQIFKESIQEALEEGQWKQDSDSSKQKAGFGVSCPRF